MVPALYASNLVRDDKGGERSRRKVVHVYEALMATCHSSSRCDYPAASWKAVLPALRWWNYRIAMEDGVD